MIVVSQADMERFGKFVTKDKASRDPDPTRHYLHYVAVDGVLTVTEYRGRVRHAVKDGEPVFDSVDWDERSVRTFTTDIEADGTAELDVWGYSSSIVRIRPVFSEGPARINVEDGVIRMECPYGPHYERTTLYRLPIALSDVPAGQYPDKAAPVIDVPAEGRELFTCTTAGLMDALKFVSKCAAKGSDLRQRPALGGVSINGRGDGITFDCTDRFIAARATLRYEDSGVFGLCVSVKGFIDCLSHMSGMVTVSEAGDCNARVSDEHGETAILPLLSRDGLSLDKIFNNTATYPHHARIPSKGIMPAFRQIPKDAEKVVMGLSQSGAISLNTEKVSTVFEGSGPVACGHGAIGFDCKRLKTVLTSIKTGHEAVFMRYLSSSRLVEFMAGDSHGVDDSRRVAIAPALIGEHVISCEHTRDARKADKAESTAKPVEAESVKPADSVREPEPVKASAPEPVESHKPFSWQSAEPVESEPVAVTQEIPEVPPAMNREAKVVATSPAVREIILPACVPLKDVPECAAYPKHSWVRDSRGRKIGYVLWGKGVAIAWRDWYVKGSDSAAEQQVMALALAKAA